MLETLEACTGTPRDRRNQRRIIQWSLAWGATFIAVVYAITQGWLATWWMALLGIAATTALGLATALAHRRFLRETDELRRLIEIEALAVAFAVGLFGGLAYWMLEVAGIIARADISYLATAMMLVYPLAGVIGRARYT